MNSDATLKKTQHVDPLREVYHEGFIDNPAHDEFLQQRSTALLCIDLQYLDAAPGYGVFRDATQSGVSESAQQYYFRRLAEMVLPNVAQLQNGFRQQQLEVVHTRIQSLTRNGRDRSKGHRRIGLL